MKASFKVSTIKAVTILSALGLFAGCPDKGGSKSAPAAVTVAGIQGNGECTQNVINAYNYIRNNSANPSNQSLRTACGDLSNLIGGQTCRNTQQNNIIALADVQQTCNIANGTNGSNNGYPNQPYPTQPGYPQPIQNVAMKNLVCSIDMNSGSAAGTISNMPVQVFANGANLRLYANMNNSKSYLGGLINVNRTFSSEKLALLGLKFKAGSGSTGDTLTLSADLRNGKSATVTGYAGSEVRIEIAADSDSDTSVIVSCTGQDNFNPGSAGAGANIKCSGTEVDGSKTTKINFINPVSDLITSGIFPSLSSDLALEGNGQSVLSATVRPVLAMESYKAVTSTVSPSSISIKSPGYSLSTNCNLQ